jgi:hypothetical protein
MGRWVLAICAMLALPARAAPPEPSPALFQATALVTGTDTRQRPLGFAETFTEVCVKLTGRPELRDDPRVKALAARAEAFAASYLYIDPRAGLLHHDDQGTYDRTHEMVVRYDPAKVEAALRELGVPVWRGARPVLVPVILVRSREPNAFLLTADAPRGAEMRGALVRVAASYGLGVRFPAEAEMAAMGVDTIGFPAPLVPPAAGEVRVEGMLNFDLHALGWVGTWRTGAAAAVRDWHISGVGYDQAFADLVRGVVAAARPPGG